MGRALVATDAPGCREVVIAGKSGYLAPVGDAIALAEAMSRLCANPLEIPMFGKVARAMVEATYDRAKVNAICMQAYREELRKPR